MDEILNYTPSAEDDYYAILGCGDTATTEQINTEFKIKAKQLHPDKNLDSPAQHEQFARLQRAREVLTDESLRLQYDRWRRAEIAIPFERWQSMRGATHAGMHWAAPSSKPMLEESKPVIPPASQLPVAGEDGVRIIGEDEDFVWSRDPASESLRRFRDYQL